MELWIVERRLLTLFTPFIRVSVHAVRECQFTQFMVRSTYVDAYVDADHHRQLFRRAERSWRRRSNRVKCPTSGRICSREVAAAVSLRFDRSVSFRLVQPDQQQENIHPQIFSVNKFRRQTHFVLFPSFFISPIFL